MPAVGVREPLDVIEECEAGGAAWREAVTSQPLAVQGREETLSDRIIEAIATASHRPEKSGIAQPSPEGQTGVLASLVRGMNDTLRWSPSPDRHVDGFDDQFTTKMIGHRPADDAPAMDVKHHRQREEARP